MKRILISLIIMNFSCVGLAVERLDLPDTRLDRPITLELAHTKLEAVAKELSEQTGVEFKVGKSARDWQVRERKVTILAKDVPAKVIVQGLSKLLGYTLSRSGEENEWMYLYWQDLKARIYEKNMLENKLSEKSLKDAEMRQPAFDRAAKALNMTPEEALRLKDENPMLAYMGGTQSGRGFSQLLLWLSNSPNKRDIILSGGRVSIPFDSLPPAMQRAALDTATGANAVFVGSNDLIPAQLAIIPISELGSGDEELETFGIGSLITILGINPGQELYQPYNDLGGEPMSFLTLGRENSLFCPKFAQALLMIEEDKDINEASEVFVALDEEEVLRNYVEFESSTEKKLPTDPKLTQEIEIEGIRSGRLLFADYRRVAVEAGILAKNLNKPVLLESFEFMNAMTFFIDNGKQPVYNIMIGLEKADYSWEFDGGSLRIQPNDWALKRSYAISESFLNYYRKLRLKRPYTLDDIAGMVSSLTDDQIFHTLIFIDDIKKHLPDFKGNSTLELLRFYASLSDQQKLIISEESGLSFNALTDSQWSHLSSVLYRRLGSVNIADGNIIFEKSDVSLNISVNIPRQEEPILLKFEIRK